MNRMIAYFLCITYLQNVISSSVPAGSCVPAGSSYKLTKEFKQEHAGTPWHLIEKMRHILVHDYFRINLDVLWIVIKEDIPLLKEQVKEYLNSSLSV